METASIESEVIMDIRQSPEYASYLKKEGWIVERIGGVNYFLRKLPLVGHILKVQRPSKIDFGTIEKLCRKYHVFEVILEPENVCQVQEIINQGFSLTKSPYLPSKTLQIDLAQSEDKIYTHFTKDCKYSIRRGEKIKIKEYSTADEIKIWWREWKNSVSFRRYVPPLTQLINLRESFPANRSLFLASHNIFSRIIGGALFTTSSHRDVAYYWYGFTNKEGRASLSQYSLLYHGILWAKRRGCKTFDFEGIYDPRFPNKNWLGFSHFKRSFGGYEVEYPGCYTKFRFPYA
jgi:hypothetical protein